MDSESRKKRKHCLYQEDDSHCSSSSIDDDDISRSSSSSSNSNSISVFRDSPLATETDETHLQEFMSNMRIHFCNQIRANSVSNGSDSNNNIDSIESHLLLGTERRIGSDQIFPYNGVIRNIQQKPKVFVLFAVLSESESSAYAEVNLIVVPADLRNDDWFLHLLSGKYMINFCPITATSPIEFKDIHTKDTGGVTDCVSTINCTTSFCGIAMLRDKVVRYHQFMRLVYIGILFFRTSFFDAAFEMMHALSLDFREFTRLSRFDVVEKRIDGRRRKDEMPLYQESGHDVDDVEWCNIIDKQRFIHQFTTWQRLQKLPVFDEMSLLDSSDCLLLPEEITIFGCSPSELLNFEIVQTEIISNVSMSLFGACEIIKRKALEAIHLENGKTSFAGTAVSSDLMIGGKDKEIATPTPIAHKYKSDIERTQECVLRKLEDCFIKLHKLV
jgi:hypothetical protein